MDGVDCIDFNAKYPYCNVDYHHYISDGACDWKAGKWCTEWGIDGGDCELHVRYL